MTSARRIFPPAISSLIARKSRPRGTSTRADGAVEEGDPSGARRARELDGALRPVAGAADLEGHAARRAFAVHEDVGIEDGDQLLDIARSQRREEALRDRPLRGVIGAGVGSALHASARPARELPRRGRRATDERGDLLEGHGEQIVEHERHALGGSELLEHDQERDPDRVGEQRLLLGIDRGGLDHGLLRQLLRERVLGAGPARAQHVQAHPGDDGRQPPSQVLDLARVGAAQPQPGLLDGVLGLGERAQHAVGHGPQVGSSLLERGGEQISFVHGHILAVGFVTSLTKARRPM